MNKKIFNFVKNKIPKISDTELIALRSGTTSIDRDILSGLLNYPNKPFYKNKFSDKKIVKDILNTFDYSKIYPNNDNNKWINTLAKNKFFSFIVFVKSFIYYKISYFR